MNPSIGETTRLSVLHFTAKTTSTSHENYEYKAETEDSVANNEIWKIQWEWIFANLDKSEILLQHTNSVAASLIDVPIEATRQSHISIGIHKYLKKFTSE